MQLSFQEKDGAKILSLITILKSSMFSKNFYLQLVSRIPSEIIFFCREGFACEDSGDNLVYENKKSRRLKCSTEKSRHKSKNKKTAGKRESNL